MYIYIYVYMYVYRGGEEVDGGCGSVRARSQGGGAIYL